MSILKRIQNGDSHPVTPGGSGPVNPSSPQSPSLQARRITAPASSIGQDTYQDLKTRCPK